MARPYALGALLWAAVMLYAACASTPPAFAGLFPQADKALHFIEYAFFALLLHGAFRHSSRMTVIRRATMLTAVVAAAYGGAIELLQGLLPHRECSALDFMANCAGAAFTLAMIEGRRR